MKKEPVYADLYNSTNPPAPPLPVEPVQYAATKKETDIPHSETNPMVPTEPVCADLHHSTNPPAPPLSVEPVQYADIKKQTDDTVTTLLFNATKKTEASTRQAAPAIVS